MISATESITSISTVSPSAAVQPNDAVQTRAAESGLSLTQKLSEQPAVIVEFSEEAMALLGLEPKAASHKESELTVQEQAETSELPAFSGEAILESQGSADPSDQDASGQEQGESAADAMKPRGRDGQPLSESDMQVISELRARDVEVRAHEQAHVAAAGGAAGAPVYQYQVGPDGKRYAVGGQVRIDVSEGATPEQTIAKAERIRSAALAPASPSPQDRAVASRAMQMATDARMELVQQKQQEAAEKLQEFQSSSDNPAAAESSAAAATETSAASTEAQESAGDTTVTSGIMFSA